MPFTKQSNGKYSSPSGRTFTKKQVKMYYSTDGFTKKKKPKIVINNKLKGALGGSDFIGKKATGKIHINVKAHKGDKAELASTIKHEMMHVMKPKATEKQVYKATAKTKISFAEQQKLIAKLRGKKLNYQSGAIKRKFKMGKVNSKPGDFISKMNESKINRVKNNQSVSKTKLEIMGLM
jgi:predicted SprT family Zn-dependent metalloprotease